MLPCRGARTDYDGGFNLQAGSVSLDLCSLANIYVVYTKIKLPDAADLYVIMQFLMQVQLHA